MLWCNLSKLANEMVKKQPSSVTLLGTKIVMCLIEKLNLDLIYIFEI